MTAGMNLKVNVWRMSTQDDDVVGGASISGSVIYSNVAARMEAEEPEQVLLQQGYQTLRTFGMTIMPGTLAIKERDEIEITAPYNHQFLNDRFRVVGIRYSSMNPSDRRNYLILNLIRSVEAHANQ